MSLSWVLLLVWLSAQTGHTTPPCPKQCPRGHYKLVCGCSRCKDGTFTSIENELGSCNLCSVCEGLAIVSTACNSTSDTKCRCRDGYYDASEHGEPNCLPCPKDSCEECEKNPNYRRQCSFCQRYCQPKVEGVTVASAKETSTVTLGNVSSATPTSRGPPAEANYFPWIWIVMVMSVLALYGLLLCVVYTRSLRFHSRCWSVNKSLVPPNEETYGPHREPGGSPTTLLQYSAPAPEPNLLAGSDNTAPVPPLTSHPFPDETPSLSDTCPTMAMSPPWPLDPLPEAPVCDKVPGEDGGVAKLPPKVLYAVINQVPVRRWKEFLRLLAVSEQQMDRVEVEAGLGLDYMEKQYQMLKVWSEGPSSKLEDVFSVLHYMNLVRCAEMLTESLGKLQWSAET